jgi:Ni,Fe-hydrogenase III large subunit
MITLKDLDPIDVRRAEALGTARESVPSLRPETREHLATRLQEAALNRLVQVTLLLSGLAGRVDDQTRSVLMAAIEEIDAAVRAARDVLVSEPAMSQPASEP